MVQASADPSLKARTADLSPSSMSQAHTGGRPHHQELLQATCFSASRKIKAQAWVQPSHGTPSSWTQARPRPPRDASRAADLIRSSTSRPGTGCRPSRHWRLPTRMPPPSDGSAFFKHWATTYFRHVAARSTHAARSDPCRAGETDFGSATRIFLLTW